MDNKFEITDEYIEACICVIALVIKDREFKDYCEYEDVVGEIMKQHTPELDKWVHSIHMGVFAVLSQIRNAIREKSHCIINM